MKRYNLFISHSWQYSDQYNRLWNLLQARRYFAFSEYSVPRDDPIHDATNDAKLQRAIRNRMSPSYVVLMIAGVYSGYSKWINIEIELAREGFRIPNPIIAIRPRGNKIISRKVREAAYEIAHWNTENIVRAIRRHG